MALTVAVLESLFTANIKDFEAKSVKVETTSKKITDKKIVSQVDADISRAQKNATKIKNSLEILGKLDTTPAVTADIAKAQKSLDKVETRLTALRGARAEMVVVADVKKAEKSLDEVAGKAGKAGAKGGASAGKGLAGGIIAALATIPIAGAVVGIGVAIGKSLMDGLQVEVRSDRLMAQTGLDPKSVAVIARVSGEAYANNFGESIAGNMDTARAAVQGGLLDPKGAARDSQAIIESLTGVADIMGEDIPRVSRSAAQAIRTGLAKDAAGAFDLLVKGTQAGLNVSEDLLDTVDEYGTQFRQLGLTGPEAFGLLSQAVKGGARDTDTAADALKEFAIRSVDMSKTSVAAFDFLGISSTEMSDTMTKGGPKAAAAMDQVLDKIRGIKDPSDQAAIAVALFGTKAEDMGTALYDMDLTTAVAQLGAVEGAAGKAVSALGDNAAGSIASAQRNIEVAADGIKGALATAFGPQIEGFATFVSENREQVMQFLLDMGNAGIDAARTFVNGVADMTEATGAFIAGPAAHLVEAIGHIVLGMDAMTPGDQGGQKFKDWADAAAAGMRTVKDSSAETADNIRTNLIENGLDPAQKKLNEIAIPMVVQARLHDASVMLATDIDGIGYAADGSKLKIDAHSGSIEMGTEAGRRLDAQIRNMVAALDVESAAAAESGETQDQLNARYGEGRQALKDSLIQMGYTGEQAKVLADRYGAIPGKKVTKVSAPGATTSAENVRNLNYKLEEIPKSVTAKVEVNTGTAQANLNRWIKANGGHVLRVGSSAQNAKAVATGGSIIGPGTGTSDDIPAMLSNGEHVLTADDVKKAGGQQAVYRIRQQIQSGSMRFAKGGPVIPVGINLTLPPARAGSSYATGAGNSSNLIAFGRMIQSMGFSVGEHPAFGGVRGRHMAGSKHYVGKAIDVNKGAGTSVTEQRALASIIGLSKTFGLGNIFMSDGHYNHAHFEAYKNGGAVHASNSMDRQSRIAKGGSNILWAEPETGWETYISGKPSQRARNIGLLKETGRRFGLAVVPANTTSRADGGYAGSMPAAPSSLAGLAIEGTLDLGNGLVGMLRGVVKSELASTGARARYASR